MAQPILLNNLKVDGAPFTEITDLTITHNMNAHGSATVKGYASAGEAASFVSRSQTGSVVKVKTTASGQPQLLFMGVVAGASTGMGGDSTELTVTLSSMSSTLDKSPENHSYQNTGETYEAIMNKALAGKADLKVNVSDHAIGKLVMQYNETPWVFCKRMASTLGGSLCTDVTSQVPRLTVGKPSAGASYSVQTIHYGVSEQGTSVTSPQYCEIGDTLSYDGGSDQVMAVEARMISGMLQTTATLGKPDQFAQDKSPNPAISGRMMKGIVQAVNMDKVQVHFVDIDASYGGGDLWLPYSTAYSSSDGSGFYCMPEVGDEVRVFMPSDDEGDAFAASSVNVSPLSNPKHKKWKSPAGKEILFTEEGIVITTKDGKLFINLSDEQGITIYSETDVNITSMKNMLLYAQNEMTVQAEKKILLSTAQSYIDITSEEIQLAAPKVNIK